MHPIYASAGEAQAVPVLFVNAGNFVATVGGLDAPARAFIRAAGYEPKPGRHLMLPAADGRLAGVLFGIEAADEAVKDLFRPGQLATLLPPGTYRFANATHEE